MVKGEIEINLDGFDGGKFLVQAFFSTDICEGLDTPRGPGPSGGPSNICAAERGEVSALRAGCLLAAP